MGVKPFQGHFIFWKECKHTDKTLDFDNYVFKLAITIPAN